MRVEKFLDDLPRPVDRRIVENPHFRPAFRDRAEGVGKELISDHAVDPIGVENVLDVSRHEIIERFVDFSQGVPLLIHPPDR